MRLLLALTPDQAARFRAAFPFYQFTPFTDVQWFVDVPAHDFGADLVYEAVEWCDEHGVPWVACG